MENRYIYGLDISLKNTGLAIYDLKEKKIVCIDSFNTENIKLTKKYLEGSALKDTFTFEEYKQLYLNAIKLTYIEKWLLDYKEKYPPCEVSIERMFSRFQTETQTIAKATGVIQKVLWDSPQYLYPPKKVKANIIKGNASKELVWRTIKDRIPNLEVKNDDESDAIAVLICHLFEKGLIEWHKVVE